MDDAIGSLVLGQRPHDESRRLAMRNRALDVQAHPDQGRLAVTKELLRL
jgi:hypothetical protein